MVKVHITTEDGELLETMTFNEPIRQLGVYDIADRINDAMRIVELRREIDKLKP